MSSNIKNKECEHIICLFHSCDDSQLMTANDLNEEIIDTQDYNEMIISRYGSNCDLLKKEYSWFDYCDSRKNTNITKFKFCPICGMKIDWKSLKDYYTNNNNDNN